MINKLAAVPLHSEIEVEERFALLATCRGFWIVSVNRTTGKAIIRRDFPDGYLIPPNQALHDLRG